MKGRKVLLIPASTHGFDGIQHSAFFVQRPFASQKAVNKRVTPCPRHVSGLVFHGPPPDDKPVTNWPVANQFPISIKAILTAIIYNSNSTCQKSKSIFFLLTIPYLNLQRPFVFLSFPQSLIFGHSKYSQPLMVW